MENVILVILALPVFVELVKYVLLAIELKAKISLFAIVFYTGIMLVLTLPVFDNSNKIPEIMYTGIYGVYLSVWSLNILIPDEEDRLARIWIDLFLKSILEIIFSLVAIYKYGLHRVATKEEIIMIIISIVAIVVVSMILQYNCSISMEDD